METIGAQDGCTHKYTSGESEWSLLDQEESQELAAQFQNLANRVEHLESVVTPSGSNVDQMQSELQQMRERLERADLE